MGILIGEIHMNLCTLPIWIPWHLTAATNKEYMSIGSCIEYSATGTSS